MYIICPQCVDNLYNILVSLFSKESFFNVLLLLEKHCTCLFVIMLNKLYVYRYVFFFVLYMYRFRQALAQENFLINENSVGRVRHEIIQLDFFFHFTTLQK